MPQPNFPRTRLLSRLAVRCCASVAALGALATAPACTGGNGEGAGGEAGTGAVGQGGTASGAGSSGTGGNQTTPGTGGAKGSGGAASFGGRASGGTSGSGGGGGKTTGLATGGSPGSGGRPGSAGSGGGSGGSTGNGGGSCATLPALDPVVGWASVSGKGVSGTTGGGDAEPVVVTTVAAFNSGAAGNTPRVINVMGTLTGDLTIGSNKTIAGICGAEIHGHVEIKGSANVILRNIKIVGYGVGNCALDPSFDATVGCSSGSDAVSVLGAAHHIWLDHCDVSDGTDGNLDITQGADYVTVSWTKFHYSPRTDSGGSDSTGASGHRFSNLVGGSDNSSSDVNALNVTWHHNWWADNVMERQPRVRYGKNHLFNNLWSSSGDSYCVRAGMQAGLLLENNTFTGVSKPQEFNSTADQATAFIIATNNLYNATTGSKATGGGGTPFTSPTYMYTMDDTSGLEVAVKAGAGPK